jgi:hypothetical protein
MREGAANMKTLGLLAVATLTLCMTTVRASEIGHFVPGVLNIRLLDRSIERLRRE